MKNIIAISLFIILCAGCSSGSSSPAAPPSTPPASGAITVASVSFDRDSVTWQQVYTFRIELDSTHATDQNISVGLKYRHSFWATDTVLSNQITIVTNGNKTYALVTGNNLWEYGYDSRPQSIVITYTATVDGVEYSKDVTLVGRFVSVAG